MLTSMLNVSKTNLELCDSQTVRHRSSIFKSVDETVLCDHSNESY